MPVRKLPTDAPTVTAQVAAGAQSPPREPIAIVGMGCRFPGARNPQEFWDLLCRGDDMIADAPADRFDLARLYHPDPGTPGKFSSRRGGYLANLDQFDADFFDISPREAERLDPQQRLLLEVAWEAVEDAGLVPSQMTDAAGGVFIGLWSHDFETHLVGNPFHDDLAAIDFQMTTGTGPYAAAGRLSFALGFRGPSMAIDTACSASLVAVHLACHSLWDGESKVALAGGVNAILSPYIPVAYSQARIIAPDGRCKFGDATANGYVRSEGCGLIVLKTLSQARADGDRVYALVRGGAVNNDGRTSHMLVTPGSLGQQEVIRKAYEQSGVSAANVQYVEAHGTGTEVGDPIELGALAAVIGPGRRTDRPCLVGSVKTNIGHTESAAGIAGLIKVACALHHGMIPASLHLNQPNPSIPWKSLPVEVVTSLRPWPVHDGPATAGVSSYGIAGTNAHIVLEGAPATGVLTAKTRSVAPVALPLSAKSPAALAAVVATMRQRIATAPASELLDDVCYTAALRREHHRFRLAVVADNREDLIQRLDALLADGLAQAPDQTFDRKLAFVYSGQGAQWIGMGRQLCETEPVFRDTLQQCDRLLQPLAGWSIEKELAADGDRSRLQQTEVVQPVIFAIQMALTALWRSWGIEPAAVVGHSIGEVTAACVAGVLSLEDAIRVIYYRGRLMQQATGRGRMVAVQMNADEAKALAAQFGNRLSLAAANGPQSVVLAGEPAAVDELVAELGKRDVACRKLPVDYAFHSPQMAPYQAELTAALRGLSTRPATLTLISTVTGLAAREGDFDGAYWARNIREPVLFAPAIEQLTAAGYNVFLEIAPHPVLARDIIHSGDGSEVCALPSLRRDSDERRTMLETLAELYAFGWPVAWSALHPQGGQFVSLPTYPWDRQRFWYEALPPVSSPRAAALPSYADQLHVLLGSHLESAAEPGTHYWQTEITAADLPQVRERRASGEIVLPATEVIDAAIATGELLCDTSEVELHRVSFEYSLVISATAPTRLQVIGRTTHEGCAVLEFYAGEPGIAGWSLYAQAAIGAMGVRRDSAPPAARSTPVNGSNGARTRQRSAGLAPAAAQAAAADRFMGPVAIVDRVDSLVAPSAIEDDRRMAGALIPELERLSISYVATALRKLGLEFAPGARLDEDKLAGELRIAPRHRRLFGRLFEMLAEESHLSPDAGGWKVASAPPATNPESLWLMLQQGYPASGPELELFGRCGSNLAAVLRGEVDPIGLLFPSGSLETAAALYRNSCFSRTANWRMREALQAAIAGMPGGRELRVLEIGAGTGGLTHHVMPLLPQGSTSYWFTDVGNWFLSQAQEEFARFGDMRFETLDIERDPSEQGFSPGGYDIVLAANCLHATRDLHNTLAHVRRLLAPYGLVLLIEGTTARRWIDLIFGLTEGWWLFSDRELRPRHPLLSPDAWQSLLDDVGFEVAAVVRPDAPRELFPQSIVIGRAPRAVGPRSKAVPPQAPAREARPSTSAAAAPEEVTGAKALRSALGAATTDQARRQVIEGLLLEQLSQLLKLPTARLDRHKAFTALGLDSLSAMGLQSRLQNSTELNISPTVIWNYPNIAALAGYLLKEIGSAASEPERADTSVAVALHGAATNGHGAPANGDKVSLPSDDELRALLSDLERLPAEEARRMLGSE